MATTQTPPTFDAATARLLADAHERRASAPPERERAVEAFFALASVAGALALPLLTEPQPFSLLLALAFAVAYAIAYRVEFPVGDGIMVPTQLVFVPMLLLLPTPFVPVLVCLGTVLATGVDVARGERSPARLPLAFSDAAFAIAPAVVLIALDAQTPGWAHWPAYVAALLAQFAVDAMRECARGLLTERMAPKVVLAEMLTVFAGEREARIHQTIELSRAYRGTALLLRDLLEEDDEYTGHHTEDVVELTAAVAQQMGVDEDTLREAEMGALLHDIGKIAVPDEIINKPGPLNDEEWAIMKTHTVEGERMLAQVGGLLADVGLVVRASHERWDGGGYPDGLAGEQIPMAARIVSACDAFNAMTTDRSYRKALSLDVAVGELRDNAGTQFDPDVVEALIAVATA